MRNGFSIIIPTFNRAGLLQTVIDSVQNLRVPVGWESEVIIVDNNSSDETKFVVNEAARKGPMAVTSDLSRTSFIGYSVPLLRLLMGLQGTL